MKLLKKISIVTSLSLVLATSLVASSSTYTVQSGDTLNAIVFKLGFSSIKESGLKAPSGDINKIFPGDTLEYTAHKKKKKNKFKLNRVIDLKKYCFKDNRSIHYRADERCK